MIETEIGEAARNWFTGQGWDCYAEVMLGSARADLVAVRGNLVAICECKTSMGIDLLDQAIGWWHRAHWVYVAHPERKRTRPGSTESFVMRYYGIGRLEVMSHRSGMDARLRDPAAFTRVLPDALAWLRKHLHPDQKNYTPGSEARAGFSTPFSRTMEMARRYIGEHPGVTLRELVDAIDHHYRRDSTARACLGNWLAQDSKVRFEREGKRIRLFPAMSDPPGTLVP